MEKPLPVKNTVPVQKAASILVVGDSISAAFGLDKSKGWVALMQRELGDNYRVINASISGDTTTGGRYRLGKALSTHQPVIVIIELGGNDGLRGTPVRQIRNNLEAMAVMSQEAGAQVILLGMQIPPNYGDRYTKAFANIYSDLALQMDLSLVPFLLEGVAGVEGMMQDDGIHPTESAQQTMFEQVDKVLDTLLSAK
ncbi:arylesterase [Oleiphilus sp. HI0068]|nr:arylesterase [Oleiphilus sp. HI0061]KZY76860.1 arylesterase [Oleiphilus sp. HI0069]KZY78368.1 arylesterase [Oleiphilus sp. HI0068]KZZ34274.1 arylesterase [Oleiphilus sp. HI0085]KZY84438.1 arylesterase [Oleiphilus sp. HI0068]